MDLFYPNEALIATPNGGYHPKTAVYSLHTMQVILFTV